MRGQTGPRLLPICLHPAPFAHHEALLLHCGKISLMFEPAASWTTSAMRKENYRRWTRHFIFSHIWYLVHVLQRAGWHTVSSSTQAKFELVTSEASYIRSLTIAVDHFMLSQELTECLGAQDKQWLFSKLPEVKDVSERWSNILLICLRHSQVFVLTPHVITFPSLSVFSARCLSAGFFRIWSTGWRKTFCDLMCATSSWNIARLFEGFTYLM